MRDWRTEGRARHCLAESALDRVDAAVARDDEDVGGTPGEQADGHDAGQLVDLGLQRRRIEDLEVVDVEDQVAVVGCRCR